MEQRGPHLHVGTHTMIMQGMLETFGELCPDEFEPYILPIQAIGTTPHAVFTAQQRNTIND